MRKIVVTLACLSIIASLSLQAGAIEVVDMTGNEATLEAYMLKIKKEVDSLEPRGEYTIAYELINQTIAKYYSLSNMQYALDHVEKHLSKLQANNINSSISIFITPKGIDVSKDFELTKGNIKRLSISNIVGLVIPFGGVLYYMGDKLSETDKANYQAAIEQTFVLVEKEKANDIISQYDLLRNSMKIYLDILSKSYPLDASEETKNEYISTRKRAETLKEKIIDAHCNYISYQVISPALAEVSKEFYIATEKWLGFDDKQKIMESITLLTHSFHNDWLFSASEDVRKQYCEVVKSLKSEIGKAEWEEYKVITTMLDSNDPSKPRGANAWWNN